MCHARGIGRAKSIACSGVQDSGVGTNGVAWSPLPVDLATPLGLTRGGPVLSGPDVLLSNHATLPTTRAAHLLGPLSHASPYTGTRLQPTGRNVSSLCGAGPRGLCWLS